VGWVSFIEEHFDAEIAVLLAVGGAFWGLLRHNDARDKEHLKEWLKRIEDDLQELAGDVKTISNNVVSIDAIRNLNDEIDELQKEINLTRERAVSVERVKQLTEEFETLRGVIQRTREQMLQIAAKEKADADKAVESIARLDKAIESKADKGNCALIHANTIKQRAKDND
jgi:predicted  nucleic acid-binding Zn-ribbon protein